jgi:hypothetical protein
MSDVLDDLAEQFHAGRRAMLEVFVELSGRIQRGETVDHDALSELHGRFFDGNVQLKRAFTPVWWIAVIGEQPPGLIE